MKDSKTRSQKENIRSAAIQTIKERRKKEAAKNCRVKSTRGVVSV